MKKLYRKKSAQDISVRQAQDKQDDIFRKMPIEKKLKLTSDFSMFLIAHNKLMNTNGFLKTAAKGSKNFSEWRGEFGSGR